MKVCMSPHHCYIHTMYITDDKEPYIEVDEEFYNECKEIENKYNEMQNKLSSFNTEYHIKANKVMTGRKIESLKKEIKTLEGQIL